MVDCCFDLVIIIIAALLLPFQAQDFSPRLPGCLLCRLGRLAPQYLGRDIFELVLQFLQRQRRVLRLLPLIAQSFTVAQRAGNDRLLSQAVCRLRLRTPAVPGKHPFHITDRIFRSSRVILLPENAVCTALVRPTPEGDLRRSPAVRAHERSSIFPHRNHTISPYPLKSKF